jgi:hypothetical protein
VSAGEGVTVDGAAYDGPAGHTPLLTGLRPGRRTQKSRPRRDGSAGGRQVRSAGDLAGLEAAGADVEALGGAVDGRADALDVGVEATLRNLARPRAGCCRSPGFLAQMSQTAATVNSWIEVSNRWARGPGNRTRYPIAPPTPNAPGAPSGASD